MLTAADGKNIYLVGGGTLGHGNQQLEMVLKHFRSWQKTMGKKIQSQLPRPLNIKHSSLNGF